MKPSAPPIAPPPRPTRAAALALALVLSGPAYVLFTLAGWLLA